MITEHALKGQSHKVVQFVFFELTIDDLHNTINPMQFAHTITETMDGIKPILATGLNVRWSVQSNQ
jgi:hypothetical protein